MESENNAVIIDNGSGMLKAGFGGEEVPKVCFPAIVGIPKYGKLNGALDTEHYIGSDALKEKGVLTLKYPVEHGTVKDWDLMKKVWAHAYNNELRCESADQPVLLTEAPRNPKSNREEMMQIFFEQFNVPAFYVYTQAVLALYAAGRTTGLVLDAGDGVVHTVVVYESYCIKHAVSRMEIGGRDLTDYLGKTLCELGHNFAASNEFEIVRDVKEKLCYTPLNYTEEMAKFASGAIKEEEYELPDGTVMKIGDQRIRCSEVLFDPNLIGRDIGGVHEQINDCVQKSDIDIRKELLGNITLSGGTTMFNGFNDRLTKELQSLAPSTVTVNVIAPNERKFSVWIGGSVLSTLATFQTSWITKEEYNENGVSIVHRKCM